MKDAAFVVLYVIYWIGHVATFGFLTFFDDFPYTWWNWIIILPLNEILAFFWPNYWLIVRPLFG